MNKSERIAHLSERLERAADARHMATTPLWAETWDALEHELIERLLACGPTDDAVRYRLQQGVEVARSVRRAIEHTSKSVEGLQKELDHLEGRAMRPVA